MIKKIIVSILIIGLFIAIKVSKFTDFIKINGVLPDIFLIITVYNGIFNGPMFGMGFGFISGLTLDLVECYPVLGVYATIYVVVGFMTSLTKYIYIDNALASSISILIFYLVKFFLYLFLGFLFLNLESTAIPIFLLNKLIQLVYTIIISIPIFFIFKALYSNSRKA